VLDGRFLIGCYPVPTGWYPVPVGWYPVPIGWYPVPIGWYQFPIGWYPIPIVPETWDIVVEVLCSFIKFFQMTDRM